MEEVLRCEGIKVELGGKEILRGVDLVVQDAQLVGVVGPNGSGKTTLIRAIAGFLPHRGKIYYAGVEERKMKRKELAKFLSVVSQEPPSSPLRVIDFVLLGRYPYLSRWEEEGEEDLEQARGALKELGVLHLQDRVVNTLSGGELQRVMLARGIVQGQKLVIMDEPTSHLDLKAQREIMTLARAITKKRAVLATFHDLTLAGQFSDVIVVLKDGKVVAQGLPERVLTPELIKEVYGVDVLVEKEPVFHVVPIFEDQRLQQGLSTPS